MLFPEYAVEPSFLSNLANYLLIANSFGYHHGRLISRYPRRWERLVYESTASCSPLDRSRIEIGLRRLKTALLPSGREFNGELTWLENAEYQQTVAPFRAVIANENPRARDDVLLATDLDHHTLWVAAAQAWVARSANDMASAVTNLLRSGSELIFIDPHFDPSYSRFRNPLLAILRLAHLVTNNSITRIEYHCQPARNDALATFQSACERQVLSQVPKGVQISFKRWSERPRGETLHDRFLLTDRAGVEFSVGLDEAMGDHGETTRVQALSPDAFARLIDLYLSDRPAFDLVDQFVGVGTAEEAS